MTSKTRGDIGGVPLWRAILRVVAGWFVMPLLIFLQPSRVQFVPFSGSPTTIRGELDFQATETPAVGVEVQLTRLICRSETRVSTMIGKRPLF